MLFLLHELINSRRNAYEIKESLLLILCLAFSFFACGTRRSDDDDDGDSVSSSRRNRDDDDDNGKGKKSKEKDEKDDKDGKDDKDVRDDTGIGGLFGGDDPYYNNSGSDIPKGYPIDEYPLYKGYEVIRGTRNVRDSGASDFELYIKYTVGDYDTINEFYRDYLEGTEEYRVTKIESDNVHYYEGQKAGYKFDIIVYDEPSEGFIGVTFFLQGIPTVQGALKSLDVVDLPPGYPSDKVPIIDGGIVNKAYIDDYNGKITYYVTVYTEKPIQEILEYYDSILNLENEYKYSNDTSIHLSGSTDDYSISIYGYETSIGYAWVPMYYIELQPKQ